jgi:hypothetical protein
LRYDERNSGYDEWHKEPFRRAVELARWTRVKRLQAATMMLAVIVIMGAVLLGAPALAEQGNRRTSFKGSCSLEGTVTFRPGATFLSQKLRYGFVGEGNCTGRLNGNKVKNISVAARQYGRAEGSCAQAQTTRPGIGELTFANDKVLNYTLEFTYLVPETDFTWHGTRSGTARGTGTFRTDRTPPDTTAKCATPSGVTKIPMDITVKTETPLVSRKH